MRSVAIIGAGWAGMSAAHQLHQHGIKVTVFESAHIPGGRAKRISKTFSDGSPLDNGQHILLGAYTRTLELMTELSIDLDKHLLRLPLDIFALNGQFRFKCPSLPAPLHSAAALLCAQGLTLTERLSAIRLMLRLKYIQRWELPPMMTVADWLSGQPSQTVRWLWEPLCIAALNTRPERASASLFAQVLRDSLDAPSRHSDFLLPRKDLSALWVDAVAQKVDMHYGRTVTSINIQDTRVSIGDESFDGVVIASSPVSAAKLLKHISPTQSAQLDALEYEPIATAYYRLERAYTLPSPIMMLEESEQGWGQWVFDRQALMGLAPDHGQLSVVCSDARPFLHYSHETCLARIFDQLQQQSSLGRLPNYIEAQWIVDKRATFAATPGLQRPNHLTPYPQVMLAGDWTNTGYPSVLEGATRSGLQAAQALCAYFELSS